MPTDAYYAVSQQQLEGVGKGVSLLLKKAKEEMKK